MDNIVELGKVRDAKKVDGVPVNIIQVFNDIAEICRNCKLEDREKEFTKYAYERGYPVGFFKMFINAKTAMVIETLDDKLHAVVLEHK